MKRLRRPPIRQLVSRLDTLALGAFVAFSLACPAFATTTSGTSMPWETPLQTVQDSLSGPVAKAIGIIAIVMTGLGFAVAESGSVVRKGIGIVFGLAIAFTATTFMSTFFSTTSGAVF
jgi:type IV secretion system protein VirB2